MNAKSSSDAPSIANLLRHMRCDAKLPGASSHTLFLIYMYKYTFFIWIRMDIFASTLKLHIRSVVTNRNQLCDQGYGFCVTPGIAFFNARD